MGCSITVRGLKKYFLVQKKAPGLKGSLKYFFKKKNEEIRAVDNLFFDVQDGELIGFIGPNGAGKTTTLKCLSGLLYPTEGQVSVLGYKPSERKEEFLKQISMVMGQKNQLWWDLPPIETFSLNKEIYDIPAKNYEENLEKLCRLLEIEGFLEIPTRKLSLGQRMKCELVAALLHDPKVLFLDEPTIGLDLVSQKTIRDFIKQYNRSKKATIILTSHNMNDVEQLCERIIIINRGKIIFDGKLSELTKKYVDHKLITAVFSSTVDPKNLEKIGQVKEFNFPRVVFAIKREVTSIAAAELLQNFPVADLNIEEVPIEDIIREIFSGENAA